jgi:MoaA/NifB/PqqE/SkfB family radical SAM enzyme
MVNITEHCNLNCAGCNQFSPLADKKYYALEIFKQDAERIFELTNGAISEITFLGGEPLLHPQITDFFDVSRQFYDKTARGDRGGGGGICILTNGILLNRMSESFWRNCKKNRVVIRITKYPITMDFSIVEETARKHGVSLYYFEDTDSVIKTTNYMPFDMAGKQNPDKSFKRCFVEAGFFRLHEGRLYPCCFIPSIHIFNAYFNKNIIVSEQDSIDIYKVNCIDEIFEFASRPLPFCRYCKTAAIRTQIPWRTSTKDISEWT